MSPPAPVLYPWVCVEVCIEHHQQCLYAELIQIVESREVAWLRPCVLVEQLASEGSSLFGPVPSEMPSNWTDLRQGPDLLLPLALVRPALDTEILPVLTLLADEQEPENQEPEEQEQVAAGKRPQADAELGRRQLNQLIYRLWQANPTCFQSPPSPS